MADLARRGLRIGHQSIYQIPYGIQGQIHRYISACPSPDADTEFEAGDVESAFAHACKVNARCPGIILSSRMRAHPPRKPEAAGAAVFEGA